MILGLVTRYNEYSASKALAKKNEADVTTKISRLKQQEQQANESATTTTSQLLLQSVKLIEKVLTHVLCHLRTIVQKLHSVYDCCPVN